MCMRRGLVEMPQAGDCEVTAQTQTESESESDFRSESDRLLSHSQCVTLVALR